MGKVPDPVRPAELPTAGRVVMFKDKLTDLHHQLWGDSRCDCGVCLSRWVMERLIVMRSRLESLELDQQEPTDRC